MRYTNKDNVRRKVVVKNIIDLMDSTDFIHIIRDTPPHDNTGNYSLFDGMIKDIDASLLNRYVTDIEVTKYTLTLIVKGVKNYE